MKINFLLVGLGAVLLTGAAFGQSTASASAGASAAIYQKLSLSKTLDLNFGNVVTDGTAGTLEYQPNGGALVPSASVTTFGNLQTLATYTLTGDSTAHYELDLPHDSTVSLAGPVGSTAMAVNSFKAAVNGTLVGGPTLTSQSLTGGSKTITVGATLNIGASQATGSYTGNFTVNVLYDEGGAGEEGGLRCVEARSA